MNYSKKMNSFKKGEGVPLLNFEGGPGAPLLNSEGSPGSWGLEVSGRGILVSLLHHVGSNMFCHVL